ncbi:MAG: sigma 54-interacting transcriptional regulator [Planctomycetota bacterium]|jgi:transcriptional regulator with GAF, ATPase, and Fis domain
MKKGPILAGYLVFEEEGRRQRVPLPDTPFVVGRGAGADLRLADRSLSALHCRFERADGGWKVVDLDSRNGTFVADAPVKQRLLEDGDRIRIGRVQLTFQGAKKHDALLQEVGKLVDRAHEQYGAEGVRRAADLFTSAAARHQVAGTLMGSEEVRATRRLQSVITDMIEERRPQVIFERIVDTLIDFTGAERGFFILTGDGEGERRAVAARNFDREGVKDALDKVSRTIERRTLEGGGPILVTDASLDERFTDTESIAGLRLRSILAVPVKGPHGPVGLIYLDNRFERGVFEERQLPIIRMFADHAAIALQNAQLHEENEHRLEDLTAAKGEVEELNRILAERVAQTSAELQEVKEHVLRERAEAPLKYSYANIIAKSRRMQDLFHLIDKVTDSDVPVLIQGESGTGKELVARAIHFNGPRKGKPFVSENCAAIPETLLESELFGYMKGAFTGATADKKGLFQTANGSTLFLDEIGDMSIGMQKKLLRVLQEHEVRPVGGKRAIPVDVRILAASNQDLRRLAAEGKFREDLFYRLNVITVEIPPLRDRREDIPLLVDRFLQEFAESSGGSPRTVSDDAMAALMNHAWPGNVRELRNEVLRAAALSDHVIVPMILSRALRGAAEEPPQVLGLGERPMKEMVKEVAEDLEKKMIRAALDRSRGRKAQAARLLGISRPTLDAKIEAYGIPVRRS